jgi:hypothetical protein
MSLNAFFCFLFLVYLCASAMGFACIVTCRRQLRISIRCW